VEATVFATVRTGTETHVSSCKMGSRSLSSEEKRPVCGVDHPLIPSAEFKERVELYFYFPSGPPWSVEI
jgi:hypothetical protein